MKKQVVAIHGGDTFETYEESLSYLKDFVIDSLEYFKGKNWQDNLQTSLGDAYEVISPRMPNKFNAKYTEWKIWFEKLVPFLNDGVVLVGYSLGGIFLVKYLSENTFPKKIAATFLIAAPFDAVDSEYSLADFVLPESLGKFEQQGGKIFLYQSSDDPIVPFVDLEKYKNALPKVLPRVFNDRGHFWQKELPELVETIKSFS